MPGTDHRTLRLLSYNVQVGITTHRPHHYLIRSWQHLLPTPRRREALERAALLVHGYDLVGLQEVDAGSLRSEFVNQTQYLAERAQFPYWTHQTNRNLGKLAQHSLGLLSRYRPSSVEEHRLPGMIPGRGALVARFEEGEESLAVIILHLALSPGARRRQLDYVAELVGEVDHALVMGDLNCACDSPEMVRLFRRCELLEPRPELHTYPAWRPRHGIDHILTTPGFRIRELRVVNHPGSDHLPIAMEVETPAGVVLPPAFGPLSLGAIA